MHRVSHIVRGRVLEDCAVEHPSSGLLTPALDLDELTWPRDERFPAADLSLDEVLDFLEATGNALDLEKNKYLQEAADLLGHVNPLGKNTIFAQMASLNGLFDRDSLRFAYEEALGRYGDGWHEVHPPKGDLYLRSWFPTRTVHVMAGNLPQGSITGLLQVALTRGVALFKLPSNDPFTAVAVLRTMAELDPEHPLVQSFSAVYWQGGDEDVESVLFRPQFFDKLIAWGGESSIRSAMKYVGPGLELVSFDPKTAISILGPETFENSQATRRAAALAAEDVHYQAACSSSRHQYVQGTLEEVDSYCEALLEALHEFHERWQGHCVPTPREIVDEVDALRNLEPAFKVWGRYDGTGLVVRSDQPVGFYPEARTVNVVRIGALLDALQYVNVATQTVGIFPPERKAELRDFLASKGADKICNLGGTAAAITNVLGRPHDGMIVLHRFVRWIYSQR